VGVWRNVERGELRRTRLVGDTLFTVGGERTRIVPLDGGRFRAGPGTEIRFEGDAAAPSRMIVSTTGETHAVSSPIGGTPLAHVPQSGPADVAEAFTRARRAQTAWAATSVADRAASLLRLHDLLLDRQEELIDLVVWESGKARKDAYLEVAHVALTARYYARTAHEHLDSQRVGGMFPVLTRAEVHRVPKGVVGIISPWPLKDGSSAASVCIVVVGRICSSCARISTPFWSRTATTDFLK
jgi:hypothetical protein